MHENLVNQAAELGLTYNFEHAIPANSLDAHRLIHFAGRSASGRKRRKCCLRRILPIPSVSGNRDVDRIAAELGLDPKEAEAVLTATNSRPKWRRNAVKPPAGRERRAVLRHQPPVRGCGRPAERSIPRRAEQCWEEEKP